MCADPAPADPENVPGLHNTLEASINTVQASSPRLAERWSAEQCGIVCVDNNSISSATAPFTMN